MDKVLVTLTVFFEDPFWVGVVERIAEGSLSASKITFGAEPGRIMRSGISCYAVMTGYALVRLLKRL